jgi:hypothetical protein
LGNLLFAQKQAQGSQGDGVLAQFWHSSMGGDSGMWRFLEFFS